MGLRDLLAKNDGTQAILEECLKVAENADRIIVFGAGVGGEVLYDFLHKNGLSGRLTAWSDNNPLKFGKSYMEDRLLIVPPDELVERFGRDICVMVASSAFDIISGQLISYGIARENIDLFNFAFMDLEITDHTFITGHMDDYERAYKRMADEKSCAIFVDILNYRITKDEKYLADMQQYVDDERYQYFDRDLYEFLPTERFVDIGAYTGDSFCVFDELYSRGWEHYYGIEADKAIYDELLKTVEGHKAHDRCTLMNLAAWDSETVLFFSSHPGSSTVASENDDEKYAVKTGCMDALITDRISLVKMDIEGAEFNALCGMRKLIAEHKPVLAICVYHLRDDFYRLTDLIESFLPGEYTFYLRQYRYTPTETVCYAIPADRMIGEQKCH